MTLLAEPEAVHAVTLDVLSDWFRLDTILSADGPLVDATDSKSSIVMQSSKTISPSIQTKRLEMKNFN